MLSPRRFGVPAVVSAVLLYLWIFKPLAKLSMEEPHFQPMEDSSTTIVQSTEGISKTASKVMPTPTKTPVHMPKEKAVTKSIIEDLLRPMENGETSHGRESVPQIASHNRKTLEALVDCVFDGTCARNQSKLIILDPWLFWDAVRGSENDAYFETSAIRTLDSFGVSYIFSLQNSTWAKEIYSLFPEQVHAVILKEGDHVFDLKACFNDPEKMCVRTPQNPRGIPAWKIFAWSSDEYRHSPLGPAWSLVSEPFSGGQTYMGFSIDCDSLPFVEHVKRKQPSRAWIHANLETYLYVRHNLWPHEWFESAEDKTGMGFVAALEPGYARLKEYPETLGIISVPLNMVELDRSRMNRAQIMEEVAQSRLLVGLLDPKELVLPYEALCMGVPYLNPVVTWDVENSSDRSRWAVENTVAKFLDPPYVYNVFHHDAAGFEAAIRGALNNPIGRHVADVMRPEAVRARWAAFLERDWYAEAVAREVLGLYS